MDKGAGTRTLFYNDSRSLFIQSLLNKLVPVEARALDREKQFAGVKSARVDRIAPNLDVPRPFECAAHGFANFFQR